MRLQKYLAEAGVGSRRACEELIRAGRVFVNGAAAELGAQVEAGDEVLLDGKPVGREERLFVALLYKPRGVVSTSDDPQGRQTVQSFVQDIPARLYNVGRLDVNSEGLLVMTNDGELAYRLTHPRFEVEKTYYAVCDGELTGEQAARLTAGVALADGPTAPARVERIRTTKGGDTSFLITIHEGRNRQVRRMLEAVGHRTLKLKREQFGPLDIGALAPGEKRILSDAEVNALRKALGLPETPAR